MMVVKLKNESMTDFIFLKAEKVEAQHPNVEDENGDSSPRREISRENSIVLNVQIGVFDDKYQGSNDYDRSSNS
jgi:hypothetical protein